MQRCLYTDFFGCVCTVCFIHSIYVCCSALPLSVLHTLSVLGCIQVPPLRYGNMTYLDATVYAALCNTLQYSATHCSSSGIQGISCAHAREPRANDMPCMPRAHGMPRAHDMPCMQLSWLCQRATRAAAVACTSREIMRMVTCVCLCAWVGAGVRPTATCHFSTGP
jgi:hypothetical protein